MAARLITEEPAPFFIYFVSHLVRLLTDVSISASSVVCPEYKKKGCSFCNGTELIHFYPSPDAYDHIEIARAKWRISQRH